MNDQDQLQAIVDGLPGDGGWWRMDGEKPFLECAQFLQEAGLQPEAIESLLQRMFNAVRSEYEG